MICCHRCSKLPFRDQESPRGKDKEVKPKTSGRSRNRITGASSGAGRHYYKWVGRFPPFIFHPTHPERSRRREGFPNSLLCARMVASLDLVGVFSAKKLK